MAVDCTAVTTEPAEPCGFGEDRIASLALRDLHAYWLGKWRGTSMPRRADIEPLEIPTLLPMVYLVDIDREPLRFRFRLVGTRVVAWFGRDLTGDYLSEGATPRYREVLESGQPAYDRLHKPAIGGRHGFCQRLLLPLAGETGVEMLLGGIHPTPVLI